MSRPFWGWLAFLHLLWIIGDGAFFVFLVLNWQVDKSKGRRGAWHEAWRMAHGVRHGVAACVVHGVWRMTHRVTASVAATLHSHQLLPHAPQAMCTPVDGRCEPRDWWNNLSIQASSELVVRHERSTYTDCIAC